MHNICSFYKQIYHKEGSVSIQRTVDKQNKKNRWMMYKIYNKKIKKSIALCILNIKK